MDRFSSKGYPFPDMLDIEDAAKKKAFVENYTSSWVRISVEGFDHSRPQDEIKNELINHFSSCGNIISVDVPADPVFESRAFVNLHGGAVVKEKALQLNGSDIGDWNALVKFAPEEEEEEYQVAVAYESSLYQKLAADKTFLFGIAVLGYDTSLPEDEVKSILTEHFSRGEITHVYVDPLDECTNIYFSEEEGEASALALNGTMVGGFKITTMRVATVRSNRRGPGTVGYCIPAHFLEFARENTKKLEDYMTQWRVNARREKLRALMKQ
ncbi:hypothetical protein HA466_0062780 [Hirschfeldia incana]|nr:hypothetical protein HA466_0062780 [Hirschfeldia incana]